MSQEPQKVSHYYGSREPKEAITETDRIILQMMDDLEGNTIKEDLVEEEKREHKETHHGVIWRFRIILSSIIILLLVIATIVISEVTKNRS